MKLTIGPTPHFFMAGEVMVRLWQGVSEDGAGVAVLVTAVAFAGQESELAASLVPIPPPTPEDAHRWAQEIMARSGSPQPVDPPWIRTPAEWDALAKQVLGDLPSPPAPGEDRDHPDPHVLRMTAFPPDGPPFDRYELTVQHTGHLLDSGPMPTEQERIGAICQAYHRAIEALIDPDAPA